MSKKKPKRKRKNLDALPETVKVSVSATFATRDLIEDIIHAEYPQWGDDIVDYLNDAGIDEILDYFVHQAQEILQYKVSDLSNLVFTDEHGQLIYTDCKFAKSKKSKKSKKSTKKNSKKKRKTKK